MINNTKFWILLIVAVTLVIYGNILKNEFLFDDLPTLVENGATEPPIDLSKIFLEPSWWSKKEASSVVGYRPMTTLSYAVNRSIHGLSVAGYHVVDMTIHAATAVVVYFLVVLLFEKKLLAGVAALLFVTHPVNSESVAGVFARADQLAAFFVLLALWCYVKAWQSYRGKRFYLVCLTTVSLIAGLATKESAVCFILIAITYEICFTVFPMRKFNQKEKSVLIGKGGALVFFLVCTVAYIFFWRPHITGQFGDLVIGEGARPPGLLHNWPLPWRLTAFKAFAYYVKLLFWPLVLSGDYLFNQIPLTNRITDPVVLTGLIFFLGFLALGLWALTRGYTELAFGILFFYAAYTPLSNLLIPIGVLVGERLLYLPSIGFCLVVAFLFERFLAYVKTKTSMKAANVVTGLVLTLLLLGYSARTFARTFHWKNPYVFFKKTSETSPNSAVSHYSTAVACLMMIEDPRYIERWIEPEEIDKIKVENAKIKSFLLEGGLESIARALEITKESPSAKYLNVYGALLAMTGKLEQAKDVLVAALSKDPNLVDAKITLGAIYIRLASRLEKKGSNSSPSAQEYLNEAVKYLQEAAQAQASLTETPVGMAEIYFNLAIVHEKLGRYAEALDSINTAFLWLVESIERTGEGKLLLARFYLIKATILTAIRDYQSALDALTEAKKAGFPGFRRYVLRMRQLRPLHRFPRFRELVGEEKSSHYKPHEYLLG